MCKSKLTVEDKIKLISAPNNLLDGYHAKTMLINVPESILCFYEKHKDEVKGKVVILRTQEDQSYAAHIRNTCDKILFVFSEDMFVDSYFSSVSHKITLSNAMLKRAECIK